MIIKYKAFIECDFIQFKTSRSVRLTIVHNIHFIIGKRSIFLKRIFGGLSFEAAKLE